MIGEEGRTIPAALEHYMVERAGAHHTLEIRPSHAIPEFCFGWRLQIRPLAAGFRVVAPDMRGYSLSSRLVGVATYDVCGLTPKACADAILEVGGTK